MGISQNKLSKKTSLGIAIVTACIILLFCLIVNVLPFIRSGILGVFGLAAYPVILVFATIGVLLMQPKRYHVAKNYCISLGVLYFLLICVLQTALTNMDVIDYAEYLTNTYNTKTTPGGVLAGVVAYGLVSLFNYPATYVLYAIGAVICGAFILDYYLKVKDYKKLNSRMVNVSVNSKISGVDKTREALPTRQITESENALVQRKKAPAFSAILKARTNNYEQDDVDEDEYRPKDRAALAKEKLFQKSQQNGGSAFSIDSFVNRAHQSLHEDDEDYYSNSIPAFDSDSNADDKQFNQFSQFDNYNSDDSFNSFGNFAYNDEPDDILNNLDRMMSDVPTNVAPPSMSDRKKQFTQDATQLEMQQTLPTPNKTTKYKRPSPYVKPPLSLLTTQSAKLGGNDAELKRKAQVLEQTLEAFKVPAAVVGITQGPAVTRYEIQIPVGISVKKIIQHADDIAMMMQSYSGVRIEAPIPGKNLVGIEIPNEKIATVGLMDLLKTSEFKDAKAPLTVALGKDIAGSARYCDLASMPHLLVAGSTGSGKSVCLNVILISLLYRLGPDDLKLILVDPKRVEFSSFNGLPHLLTPEAICQPKQAWISEGR